MKMIRRITISLSIALLGIVCGALILFNWSATGWKALTVQTGSMRPGVPPGSLVLMHRVPSSSLKVGDVITYTNPLKPGTTITHRIVKSYKIDNKVPAYITKGDANFSSDQPIVGGEVLGKAIWHAPHIGAWLNWTKKPIGLLALIYIPAIFVMAEEVVRLNNYYKLSKPYESGKILARRLSTKKAKTNWGAVSVISIASVAIPVVIAFPVQAMLRSNTVALVNNRITVASPISQCTTSGNSTTITVTGNVSISNTNNQNANSGNVSTGSGGSATSDSVSNTNCTNINVTITNTH